MSCALRVNTATMSASITPGEGQQNGAGESSPLRFLLLGRAGLCLVLLLSLRALCGGRFPSNVSVGTGKTNHARILLHRQIPRIVQHHEGIVADVLQLDGVIL